MASLRHHSPSPDHEHLLRDFQGQESDHEQAEEDEFSEENDSISDGGGKRGIDIYPRHRAGRIGEDLAEDFKPEPEHQDHHITIATATSTATSFDVSGTKQVSPHCHSSVPLPYHFYPSVRLLCLFNWYPHSYLHHHPPPPFLPFGYSAEHQHRTVLSFFFNHHFPSISRFWQFTFFIIVDRLNRAVTCQSSLPLNRS
jgi:hypothetical protein